VVVTNLGNTAATGTLSINLYESNNVMLDLAIDPPLESTPAETIDIRAGKKTTIHIPFTAPAGAAPGSYFLIATITSSASPTTNMAVVGTR